MVWIMDMKFKDDEAPDFGSIEMVGKVYCGVRKYVLLSEDVSKLDLITNAGSGSAAVCADTGDVYIKHDETWYKI